MIFFSTLIGSGQKVMDGIALDLSKTKWPNGINMYNVTLVTERYNPKYQKKTSDTFHLINLDYEVKNLATPAGLPLPRMMMGHENKLIDDIVRGYNTTLVEHLDSYHFDVGMSLGFPFEHLLLKSRGVPGIKWLTYFPDPIYTAMAKNPLEFSHSLPSITPSDKLFRFGY